MDANDLSSLSSGKYVPTYYEDFPKFPDEPYDNVNSPYHYTAGAVECIDVILDSQGVKATQDFCICNAFKYLFRHRRKNGDEDLRKAQWYLNKYFELGGASVEQV